MSNLTEIKLGRIIKIQGAPYLVVWCQFNRKQQRKPVMRTKMKNLITGGTMEKTYMSGESYEFADVENRRYTYLYKDKDGAVFMDNETYDQITLPLDQVEGALAYLKDNTEVYVNFFENKPIGVQPPIKVELKVIETPPGVKGDTATGGSKPAKMETGVDIDVPLFIQEGEMIVVNTETGEYVSRAST